ncbi:hypothetical protein tb265_27790 [Gemmatimonadetes bacterium T265]|nr:hypothetical protein tb265_27790 [Gemmatimonadetes bacterium T265]
MPGPDGANVAPSAAYDGTSVEALRTELRVPALHTFAVAPSTMDLAHVAAGEGAAAGTTFVADVQTAGRGRNGRRWVSDSGAGVWATVVERPSDVAALPVLSLRVGLALAAGLESLGARPIALKWPNDLLLDGRKLAGILVEARWREGLPEWVAVGVGVNRVTPAEMPEATGLGAGVRRVDILAVVVAAARGAAARGGVLGSGELAEFERRDAVRGRAVIAPVAGRAAGVSVTGGLLVRTAAGPVVEIPTASVQYADEVRADRPG